MDDESELHIAADELVELMESDLEQAIAAGVITPKQATELMLMVARVASETSSPEGAERRMQRELGVFARRWWGESSVNFPMERFQIARRNLDGSDGQEVLPAIVYMPTIKGSMVIVGFKGAEGRWFLLFPSPAELGAFFDAHGELEHDGIMYIPALALAATIKYGERHGVGCAWRPQMRDGNLLLTTISQQDCAS